MGKALKRAVKIEARRQELNRIIDKGGDAGINARRAKKVLADKWYDRGESPGSFHNPDNMNTSVLTVGAASKHIRTSI